MIKGFAIGHHTADGDGWLTGTTVIFAPRGAVGGVDVRGGGPGTRETDLLAPDALVERVDAIVLTGGSAYGLASVDGVMAQLEQQGRGFPIGPGVVPIVPAAVLFDLGRGGDFSHRPTADFGAAALAAASTEDPPTGCVGAGTGAKCGGLKGGFGYAEQSVPGSEGRVAAAVAVNAAGSAVDPRTGRLWADVEHLWPEPTPEQRDRLAVAAMGGEAPRLNTTIGVVLTDLALTKAQAHKVAATAHDGLARAIRPAHSMLDGDTIFCLSSGSVDLPEDPVGAIAAFNELLAPAADVFAAGCLSALTAARSRGGWMAYAEIVPGE